ncbi:MAG: HlyD family efflux transporter periplasmic adaptor subunit [Clostridiales bacterium]|nr:HlyD family efflux transporter periplasmic adaptor subunit [Candidatus Cacconaster stercorequi]
MRKDIININEMSDSKEIYGHRPNPFISVFIYCIVGLLVAAILYACVGEIEIVATAVGTVRPNDDVSTLSSLLSGRVTNANYTDGQVVHKGDILLSIDTAESQILLDSLKDKKKDFEWQKNMLEKFRQGVENGANPFSSDAESKEYAYYTRYRDYELSRKDAQDNFTFDASTTEAKIGAIRTQIEGLEDQLAGLKSFKSSVQKGSNQAKNYPEYDKQYQLYVSTLDALDLEYQSQKKQIEQDTSDTDNKKALEQCQSMAMEYGYLVKSIQNGKAVFPKGDTSTCKTLYDEYCANVAAYEQAEDTTALDIYKNKTLADYQQALAEYESRAADLQSTISSSESKDAQLAAMKDQYENKKEQQKLQMLTQIDSSIQGAETELTAAKSSLQQYQISSELYSSNTDGSGTPITVSLTTVKQLSEITTQQETLKEQLDELNTQIKQAEDQVAQGSIVAKRSGVISVNSIFVKGDTITAGTVIGTIIPFNESEFRVNMYVKNSDIANIEVGDVVRYNLSALPSSQYGALEGVVTKISSDTLVQNGEYSGYYLVEGSIPSGQLKDKDGNVGSVSVGMQLEAKIVTQKKTIIRYLLEKIKLF